MVIVSSNIDGSDFRHAAASKRLVDPAESSEEKSLKKEDSLRPTCIDEFIGQSSLKKILEISTKAALSRREAMDHLLLYGPPGLGKTTMAMVLAKELGVKFRITSAPALERPRDIIGLLVNMEARELLFVDEIHRLPRIAEELLYPAMEDFRLDLTVGRGSTSRIRSIQIPKFTLVGATTRPAAISSPMRDRFGIIQRLNFYNQEDLQNILNRSAKFLGLSLTSEASLQLAKRCRGTPRIANRLLRRVRDFATVQGILDNLNEDLVNEALHLHAVDNQGLDATDRKLLTILMNDYDGGPVGLDTLAAALGEDSGTLETVVEPFLIQSGLLQRTARGRVISPAGRDHLSK